MKWIGTQSIYDDIRFYNGVTFKGGNLITFEGGLTSNDDIVIYDATNDGNPTISLGSSATERLEIKAQYESGAQGLDGAIFTTYTAGSSTNDGRFTFFVDEVGTFQIRDHGINLYAGKSLQIGNTDIISDSGGTATLSNIDALDATTEATIESAIDTLSNLTTVGTIGTGVWNATKILSPKTTHVIHYSFKGTCTGIASGNFQYAEDMLDAQYPFQLNTDYGNTVIANGDLSDVSTYFRSSGTVMPRACTAIDMVGWGSCAGTDEVTISLCKVTPTRDDSTTNPTPVVVATTTFTALNSNDKLENFSVGNSAGDGAVTIVTSAIAAGDILMPFVISPNTKAMYFNMTLDVEV